MSNPKLISEEYREQQAYLHDNYEYGTASIGLAPLVSGLIDKLEVDELLDYGSGRGNLSKHLSCNRRLRIQQYEPSNPKLSDPPEPSEFVACLDVLEHIEPELLDNVLDDLLRVTRKYGFFTIHIFPAAKHLPDGRNAHLIQKPASWWLPHIEKRFNVLQFTHTPNGFNVLCEPIKEG